MHEHSSTVTHLNARIDQQYMIWTMPDSHEDRSTWMNLPDSVIGAEKLHECFSPYISQFVPARFCHAQKHWEWHCRSLILHRRVSVAQGWASHGAPLVRQIEALLVHIKRKLQPNCTEFLLYDNFHCNYKNKPGETVGINVETCFKNRTLCRSSVDANPKPSTNPWIAFAPSLLHCPWPQPFDATTSIWRRWMRHGASTVQHRPSR